MIVFYLDGIQKHNRQRQKLSSKRKDRRYVEAFQKPHDGQTRREECPKWSHGHIQGSREELISKAMRHIGRRFGHDQAILPRWWQRAEEDILREKLRAAKS